MPTPIENIEEFKVATANQTADFNGSAGGQVQMVTKRGTNQFHGAAYRVLTQQLLFGANLGKTIIRPSDGLPYTPLAEDAPEPVRRIPGRTAHCRSVSAARLIFYQLRGAAISSNHHDSSATVPTALLRAGVIQLPNSSGRVPGLQPESDPGDHRRQ